MSIDAPPETESDPQPPRPQRRGDRDGFPLARWWRRGLLAIGMVAVVWSAAALISGASSSREAGSKLTHTVTRGDLIVTVTEQGTLESSDNAEIICKVRGRSTVIWVIPSGSMVEPGDELVRLDTLFIEEQINERTKYAHWSRSAAERSEADLLRSELAIPEYLEGRYRSQLMTLEKDQAIAESNLRIAQNLLDHTEKLLQRGYVSELELEEKAFAVTRSKLNVEVKTTEIAVLKDFTKAMELETLNGNFKSTIARHEANKERAVMDGLRRDKAVAELEFCVVKAERGGMVIHPSAARWKNAPEIEQGTRVWQTQVMLLMPDLSKMQVKLGIHESIVKRVRPGLAARVTLPDKTLKGEVSSVASVTVPASWWTGNAVLYDTLIELPPIEGLKPGMSAEVEIIIDRHENVLTIPVAAIVETAQGNFCWVKTADGAKRRSLELGDTNDVFTIVQAGLKEGDRVVLNPFALEEVQIKVLGPGDDAKPTELTEPGPAESDTESKPQKPASANKANDSGKRAGVEPKGAKSKETKLKGVGPKGAKPKGLGAKRIKPKGANPKAVK